MDEKEAREELKLTKIIGHIVIMIRPRSQAIHLKIAFLSFSKLILGNLCTL